AVTDLKRIIAYSTISQIGYMVVGVSIGAYGAGLFHLMTHAFFKALLFMGAGSVISAMAGTQDIDRMGGLRRAIPFTSTLMIGGREDTDVGFPGSEHHIAERDWPMRWAMAALGFGAIFGGLVQVPGVTNVIESFLRPTFTNSPFESIVASDASAYRGLLVG